MGVEESEAHAHNTVLGARSLNGGIKKNRNAMANFSRISLDSFELVFYS